MCASSLQGSFGLLIAPITMHPNRWASGKSMGLVKRSTRKKMFIISHPLRNCSVLPRKKSEHQRLAHSHIYHCGESSENNNPSDVGVSHHNTRSDVPNLHASKALRASGEIALKLRIQSEAAGPTSSRRGFTRRGQGQFSRKLGILNAILILMLHTVESQSPFLYCST